MPQSKHVKSGSSAASRAQVRANRRNAKRSTGPRTDVGKRVAARNAVTHGVFSKDAVLPGERDSEYVAFRNLLFGSPGLMPQDWLECSIAEQYVLARWRIRRLQTVELLVHHDVATMAAEGQVRESEELERAAADAEGEDVDDDDGEEGDADAADARLRDVPAPYRHLFVDEDDEEDDESVGRRVERRRRALAVAQEQPMPIHATMAAALTIATHASGDGVSGGADAFERIARNRYRLELSASRAMRELRQLRKDTGTSRRSSPARSSTRSRTMATRLRRRATRSGNTASCASGWRRTCGSSTPCAPAPRSTTGPRRTRRTRRAKTRTITRTTGGAEGVLHASGGVVTSDFDQLSRVVTTDSASDGSSGVHQNALSDAPVQNEPNSGATSETPDASGGCDAGTCNVELIEPTKLAPSGAVRASEDERGGADQP